MQNGGLLKEQKEEIQRLKKVIEEYHIDLERLQGELLLAKRNNNLLEQQIQCKFMLITNS